VSVADGAAQGRLFPHVRLRGDFRARGCQYGEQAKARVHGSLEAYERVFEHCASWDWRRVCREALRFVPAIEALEAGYLEEMQGIADGAGVQFEDILALNVRTEVVFAAEARRALATPQPRQPRMAECSAFCLLPQAASSRHTLLGQNWDWYVHCRDTVVVLEAEQEERPNYVTVVEAGLLAKAGINSCGLGLATNALVTAEDRGEPGVPYHLVLRAIMDCRSVTDAVALVQRVPRASSANYLVAHRDGVALDLECAPGDFGRVYVLLPENGTIVHTNHFLSPRFDLREVSLWAMPDSAARLVRLRAAIADRRRSVEVDDLVAVLSDHAEYPASVCCHPDERDHPQERAATIASLVMDLDDQRLLLADGNPCATPFRELDYRSFFDKSCPIGRVSEVS
jgi:isopenicillin-N N-acyltransferase-like protein